MTPPGIPAFVAANPGLMVCAVLVVAFTALCLRKLFQEADLERAAMAKWLADRRLYRERAEEASRCVDFSSHADDTNDERGGA